MDEQSLMENLDLACRRYQHTAPAVHDHCDELYRRICSDPGRVSLLEVRQTEAMWKPVWLAPDLAMVQLGRLRRRAG